MPRGKAAASKAKTSVKKELQEEMLLQYAGAEWNITDVKEKIIAGYVAEGHRRGNIKKLTVYVKPEEGKVYYVINEKVSGSVEL